MRGSSTKLSPTESVPAKGENDIAIDILYRAKRALHRWRVPLAIAGAFILIGGMAISVRALDLERDDIVLRLLILNLFGYVPIGLALAAVNLQFLARGLGRRIGFAEAFMVSALGRVAEVLPLPGGALVRGVALMRAGAALGESAGITLITGLLTLAMSFGLSGAALTWAGFAAGNVILVAGLAGTGVCSGLIARRAGVRFAAALLALRIAVLALGALRLVAAFGTIGVAMGGAEAAIFIVCTTLSSAITIVPAGLGVAEAAAASLALFVNVSPAAAFLAVGLNATLGLAFCGVVSLIAIARAAHSRNGEGPQEP